MSGSLVVSVHDVSPLTASRVEAIVADLASWGVPATSLLVVPNHHRKGHFLDDEPFCGWLQCAVDSGHEAVLHGYFHLREQRRDGWLTRLTTEHYTAGEGEFFDIGYEEAMDRLSQGRRDLQSLGLDPVGFIAPAWLLGKEGEDAARECGFRYTTRISQVVDLQTRRTTSARSLVWSVRAPWRRRISLLWNRWLLRRQEGAKLIRVGIHPPDWDYPEIRDQIRRSVGSALAGRTPMTYHGWLERQTAAELS